MKKVIIIIICFFVFVLMLKMIACQSQIETNVFSINESRKRSQKIEISVDFGIITDGQVKEKQFYLLNQSEKVFKVNEFRPSCGCTSMIIDATTVAPGSKLKACVRYTPGRHKEMKRFTERLTLRGEKGEKIIYVFFDIKVQFIPNVEYSPNVIRFTNKEGDAERKKITIRLNNLEKVTITDIESPDMYTIFPKIGDSLKTNDPIIVERKMGDSSKDFFGEIKIFLDCGNVIDLYVTNKEEKPFTVKPEFIHFYITDQIQEYVQTINITPNSSSQESGAVDYSSPFEKIVIEKKETKNRSMAETINVKLLASDIDSSTKTFLIISNEGLQQKIPIWITKIN